MGRAPCCDKANVKKGPWSPEEDATLKAYIEKNGTGGNWIALPQKIGLKRCGKSCRLRWLNYLRPNIRHGGFSEEEDNIICSLYTNIGSRWSIIAAQLPGRTDNDIKNYWNTRLKKRLLGPSLPAASRARRIAVATEVPNQSSTSSAGINSWGHPSTPSNKQDAAASQPEGAAAVLTLNEGFVQVNHEELLWDASSLMCPQIQEAVSQPPPLPLLSVLTTEVNPIAGRDEQTTIRRLLMMMMGGRFGSSDTVPLNVPAGLGPAYDCSFEFDATASPPSATKATTSYSSLLATVAQQQQSREGINECYEIEHYDANTEGELAGFYGTVANIVDDGASGSTTTSSESNSACWNGVCDPLLFYPPLNDLLTPDYGMQQQLQRSSLIECQQVHPAARTR